MDNQIVTTGKLRLLPFVTNPKASYLAIKATTIREAVESENPSIAAICVFGVGIKGREMVVALLVTIIADMVEFLNVGKTMNHEQILGTVRLILDDPETKNFKPDDFKVFSQKFKKGEYGKSYDRIDGQTLFEAMKKYAGERLDIAEEVSIKKHEAEKKKQIEMNPEIKDALKKALENPPPRTTATGRIRLVNNTYIVEQISIEEETIREEKKKGIIRIEKSDFDKNVQLLFQEFDDLFHKEGIESGKKRFVKINGKELDQVEYVEYRLKSMNV